MDKASEAILALKPVTFRYKKEIDPAGIAVRARGRRGGKGESRSGGARQGRKTHTVRYDQVNAMLLNEFLKEHHTVEEQQSKIANQQASITAVKGNGRTATGER